MSARIIARLTFVLFGMLFLAWPFAEAASKQNERPNVVIFLTDDVSWLERSGYGWANLPTPAFDRVADEGEEKSTPYVAEH